MNVLVYERYVDDSNQVAVVPSSGTRYNLECGKVVVYDSLIDEEECDDEKTAKVLTDIAKSDQSVAYRNRVHTQEILRSLINSSHGQW